MLRPLVISTAYYTNKHSHLKILRHALCCDTLGFIFPNTVLIYYSSFDHKGLVPKYRSFEIAVGLQECYK